MMSKIVLISLLATFTVANAAKLSSSDNKDVMPLANESRLLLELPIIGAVALKAMKVVWFIVSTACSIIGYKFTALALVASAAMWIFKNSYTFILGATLAYGFCKLTGKCNWFEQTELIGLNGLTEQLAYAAKNLDEGITKYA